MNDDLNKNVLLSAYQEEKDNHCTYRENLNNPDININRRRRKICSIWNYLMTLRSFFRLFGENVGNHPFIHITLSLSVSLFSLGILKMDLKDRIRDGYTPSDAPSRYEMDIMREFWNSSGDPLMVCVMLVAKDDQSMLRDEYLDEAVRFSDFFSNNFTVDTETESFKYQDICAEFCNLNIPLDLFKQGVDDQRNRFLEGRSLSEETVLSYPVSTVAGIDLHLERFFFGVKKKASVEANQSLMRSNFSDTDKNYAHLLSNMDFVKVVMLLFRADKRSESEEEILTHWELSMYKYARQIYKSDLIDAQVIGSEILNQEMIKDGRRIMPFFAAGVDGAFLMTHAWQMPAEHCSDVALRLAMVFEEAGPSITIGSLTNFIAFSMGAFTPTPEIRLFNGATALAIGLNYFFELILFGPILTLATKLEKKNFQARYVLAQPHGWRLKMRNHLRSLLKAYCRLIMNRFFIIFLTVAIIVCWYYAVVGALSIETRLDTEKILPRDSPIQVPNKILSDYVWPEYYQAIVLVNKLIDPQNRHEMDRLWQIVDDFERIPSCRGNISTLLWLRDYEKFYEKGDLITNIVSAIFGSSADTQSSSSVGIDFSKLDDFLQSPFYKHWKSAVRTLKIGNETQVSRFWFSVAYKNMSSWQHRIDILLQWRSIAVRYEDLNVTVWEANSMFVDQMLSLKSVAIQSGVWTLVCMVIVCTIFIPNPFSILIGSISIVSISMGVFGFLSWWSFDLDPVTTAALLMSIGLSVDFTAHVLYHLQLINKKEIRYGRVKTISLKDARERLESTLESIGWPMIQASASTIVCILPLLFLQSYAPMVFVKTIILVVCWGTLHGIVVLPTFLTALPGSIVNFNIYRLFLKTNNMKSSAYRNTNQELVDLKS